MLNRCIFSSIGQDIYHKGPIKDDRTAKPTHHNLPSVSHLPLTESYNNVLLLNSRLKTPQSSDKIPSTQLFPDVSPTSYLMTEQLSITQHSDTIQPLSSLLTKDVMSPLYLTTQDVSSTTLTGQLTLSGQTELESSLSTSLLEPSVMFTTALPSEFDFFSGQIETSDMITPVFTLESLKASSTMPPWQTFFKSLPPDIGVSKTISSDISQPTYPSWALQTSLPLTKPHHMISVPLTTFKDQPFKEQTSAKSAHASTQFMPSMQQTLDTLLLWESQQTDMFSHISSIMYLTTAVLATSVTYQASLLTLENTRQVSEDHLDPTAPSTVQEPYTTSFIHEIHNPDPSFLLCGQSQAQDHVYISGCTQQIKSTSLESTKEDVLISYSQDEKHWTSFQSQFLMSHSSGASNPTMHLSASTTTGINHVTATPQMDISDTLPSLEDSDFSVITYTSLAPSSSALCGNCVSIENSLLIRQTDSSGPFSKGQPTQQILSTSLSSFYGMSTTLLTSLQAVGLSSYRRQSSVQPTPSSALISSKYHQGYHDH